MRSEDAVSDMGNQFCLNQCKLENKMYFKFLDSKLQKLIKAKSYQVNVRITDFPITSKPPKKYYKCVKHGYKKYTCECVYEKYTVKTDEQFKKKFHEIFKDVHEKTPSPDNCKMLEDRYKVPTKLIAFLISYHLMPTEIFEFLLWWHSTENFNYETTMTGSKFFGREDEDEKEEEENEEEEEEEGKEKGREKKKQF